MLGSGVRVSQDFIVCATGFLAGLIVTGESQSIGFQLLGLGFRVWVPWFVLFWVRVWMLRLRAWGGKGHKAKGIEGDFQAVGLDRV